MRQRVWNWFAAIGMATCLIPSQATELRAAGHTVVDKRVSDYVDALMQRHSVVGAAVAIVHKGKVIHRSFHGLADRATKVPVGEKTLFRIFSMTKIVVATAVMKLIEDKKLSLETKVGEILVELPSAWQDVRIKHLLSHSSGLPEIQRHFRLPESEARANVYKEPVMSPPGQRFQYNQTNYWLLQRVIQQVSGAKFREYIFRSQFGSQRPSVVFCGNFYADIPDRSQSYFPDAVLPEQKYDYLDAGNGLNVTLDELVAWNLRLDRHGLLSPTTKQLMWGKFDYRLPADFGLGWRRVEQDDGTSVGFSGSGVTVLRKFPRRDLTVVFLGNGFQTRIPLSQVVADLAALVRSSRQPQPESRDDNAAESKKKRN
ncbi:MAG: serine hydrolase domain-containing protein [Pirellulaceae bacterium]